MVVAFYFRLHLAYFPRPVVAIFARPEHRKHMTEFFRYNCYSKAINFGGIYTSAHMLSFSTASSIPS